MKRLPLPWTTLIALGDVNAKSFYPATGWVSGADAKQMVRFGWMVWYNTGGAVGLVGRVGGVVEYGHC